MTEPNTHETITNSNSDSSSNISHSLSSSRPPENIKKLIFSNDGYTEIFSKKKITKFNIEREEFPGFIDIKCKINFDNVNEFRPLSDTDNDTVNNEIIREVYGDSMKCSTCYLPRSLHKSSTPKCGFRIENGDFPPGSNRETPNGYCISCLMDSRVCLVGKHIRPDPQSQSLAPALSAGDFDEESQVTKKMKIDSPLQIFFEAIFSNHYKIDSEKRIWTFDAKNTSAEWINDTPFDRFYNRKCYDSYIKILFDKNNTNKNVAHYLGGTSGTGKSSFVNVLFVRIAQEHLNKKEQVTILYQIKTEAFQIILNDSKVIVQKVTGISDLKSDFCISDTCDVQKITSRRFTILISSPKEDNFRNYREKLMAKNPKDLAILDRFIPVWSPAELAALTRDNWNLNENQINYRYSVVGGSARSFLYVISKYSPINFSLSISLLKLSPPEFQPDIVADVIKFMTNFPNDQFSESFKKKDLLNNKEKENELNDAVVEYCTESKDIFVDFYESSSNFSHFYDMCFAITEFFALFESSTNKSFKLFSSRTIHYLSSSSRLWASDIIHFIVKQFHPDPNDSFWTSFSSVTGSAQGGVYESRIHKRLIENPSLLKNTNSIRAHSANSLALIDSIEFTGSELKEYIIHKESDIEFLTPYIHYGNPKSQVYPAIDAIIQPNILIQITTGSSHNKLQYLYTKSTKFLKEKDKKKIILFFITPPDVEFEFDKDLKDIQQFQLKLDPIPPSF